MALILCHKEVLKNRYNNFEQHKGPIMNLLLFIQSLTEGEARDGVKLGRISLLVKVWDYTFILWSNMLDFHAKCGIWLMMASQLWTLKSLEHFKAVPKHEIEWHQPMLLWWILNQSPWHHHLQWQCLVNLYDPLFVITNDMNWYICLYV